MEADIFWSLIEGIGLLFFIFGFYQRIIAET